MPVRYTPLVNGEYYHIFNRGISHQLTYMQKKDYERFLLCLSYYLYRNTPYKLARLLQLPLDERNNILNALKKENDRNITICSYALMPNHFHLLVRQEKENGISETLKHISDAYTRYFNTKYKRYGPLYQGAFKAARIETDEQFLHVSRYIHLNPLVNYVVKESQFLSYTWSSLPYFISGKQIMVDAKPILAHFQSRQAYLTFVLDQADYGRELAKIKHLTLEK